MKICIITSNKPNNNTFGGVETLTNIFYGILLKKKFHIDFITPPKNYYNLKLKNTFLYKLIGKPYLTSEIFKKKKKYTI